MKWLYFHVVLYPLIVRNYALRYAGRMPDEWYWADELAVQWGYFGVNDKIADGYREALAWVKRRFGYCGYCWQPREEHENCTQCREHFEKMADLYLNG